MKYTHRREDLPLATLDPTVVAVVPNLVSFRQRLGDSWWLMFGWWGKYGKSFQTGRNEIIHLGGDRTTNKKKSQSSV
jgi:hypothetical protein